MTVGIYEILLATGGLGLLAMAFLGFAHFGGAHSSGHAGGAHHVGHAGGAHAGPASLAGRVAPGGHGARGGGAPVSRHAGPHAGGRLAPAGGLRGGLTRSMLALLSPLTLFAACLGAGLVGLLLTGAHVSPLITAVCAAAAAIAFNAVLVNPIMRLVMGFASEPAQGLAGTLMQDAEAITGFDANGEGLVRVLVDGQSVDVLARLTEEERQQGARVVRGQRVLVEDVDTHHNRCTVSRL